MKKVYLAGAIFNNPNAAPWRIAAKQMMPEGWAAVDPMDFEVKGLEPDELVQLDYRAIQECQAIIAYVQKPSWGTPMEMQYAKWMHLPVIGWANQTFDKKKANPWLVAHVTKFFFSLQEACMELRNVL
jgi:nucleoside 2-deoxyribosyltransferase